MCSCSWYKVMCGLFLHDLNADIHLQHIPADVSLLCATFICLYVAVLSQVKPVQTCWDSWVLAEAPDRQLSLQWWLLPLEWNLWPGKSSAECITQTIPFPTPCLKVLLLGSAPDEQPTGLGIQQQTRDQTTCLYTSEFQTATTSCLS